MPPTPTAALPEAHVAASVPSKFHAQINVGTGDGDGDGDCDAVTLADGVGVGRQPENCGAPQRPACSTPPTQHAQQMDAVALVAHGVQSKPCAEAQQNASDTSKTTTWIGDARERNDGARVRCVGADAWQRTTRVEAHGADNMLWCNVGSEAQQQRDQHSYAEQSQIECLVPRTFDGVALVVPQPTHGGTTRALAKHRNPTQRSPHNDSRSRRRT